MKVETYVDYTKRMVESFESENKNYAIFGSGFNIQKFSTYSDFYVESGTSHFIKVDDKLLMFGGEIIDVIENFKNSSNFKQLDYIVLSRVFEHLPIRTVDYYLYLFSCVLNNDGKLILVVPDHDWFVEKLTKEAKKENPNYFQMLRYNFAIFDEGLTKYDTHRIYCNRDTMRIFLTNENLFEIESIKDMFIDTTLEKDMEIICKKK